ncbi:MAG: beta-galactosidase [Treponemataceae bacterium]|nr:beta-galactosidase [Treponemataceae bacterium]
MSAILNGNSIDLGVCYYPEHWDEKLWKTDLDRMISAGLKTIRIAEFAWNLIEPHENSFDYSFFDRFLDLAKTKGIQVIFCTPTATPPAWLTEKYPEVLNADIDGHLIHHGSRRHYNYNSPVYREFAARITEKSASHYAKHPAIIGWQLDNEFNCEANEFYSKSDDQAFRVFVQKKYGSLDELNKAWGTVFWNQTYSDWNQVHLPRRTNSSSPNPHLHLDYLRFISDSVNTFASAQAKIIRKYAKPGDFITTNGLFGNIDYVRLTKESLDFMTYDSYPNFAYCINGFQNSDFAKDREWSRNLTETRAVSGSFGIMEQQSGANGWTTSMEAPAPRPGQISLWALQSIAHGADYVSFFRWRTAAFGTEIYWHGILDYSGRNNRRLEEITELSRKIENLQCLAGSRFHAKVAIVKDYDNIWDSQFDVWKKRIESQSHYSLFKMCQLLHVPFDYVYAESDTFKNGLSSYNVVFYPHPSILTEERIAVLEKYAAEGGTVVFGCRTGYKEIHGKCVDSLLPGLAAKLSGTDIPEYSLVPPDEVPLMVNWPSDSETGSDSSFEAAVFVDELEAAAESASVVARYSTGSFGERKSGAVVHNAFGKGHCYYFGGAFSDSAAEVFLKQLKVAEPYGKMLSLPQCCEMTVRKSDDGTMYFFVLNYSKSPVEIEVLQPMYELFDKSVRQGKINLSGYGVCVFKTQQIK